MKLFTCSRLFGILLIAASLPLDPGVALAVSHADAVLASSAPPGSIEARLRRIAAAVRAEAGPFDPLGDPLSLDPSPAELEAMAGEPGDALQQPGLPDGTAISYVVIGPNGVGWKNGGWRNGGFYNGGFHNGGFRNGGFYNGGFRNGGFRNGGFRNGGFLNGGGFRNGGFRNHW